MLILELLRGHPVEAIALITALVVGLTVHEYAHARMAFGLGDMTAYMSGRMTLNPRAHIDPLGALVFLVAGFGWARPVPVDGYRLGRRGMLLVSVAGPASNVLLAVLFFVPLRLGLVPLGSLPASFLLFFAYLNIVLAVFNMLPVAPLDGWKVLLGVVPATTAFRLQELERYGGMLLLLLILVSRAGGGSLLGAMMAPFIQLLLVLVAGPDLAAQL